MKSTWLLLAGIAIGALGSGTYIATSQRDLGVSSSAFQSESSSVDSQPEREKRTERRPLWNPNKGTKSKTISNKDSATGAKLVDLGSKPPVEPSKTETRPLVSNTPRPIPGTQLVTEEELADLAARIEGRANRELDRLSRLLDLSEEQQNRIFPLLARSSTAFHPALAVQVGEAETSNVTNLPETADKGDGPTQAPSSPAASSPAPEVSEPLLAKEADQEIHEILTEEQKQVLEDELVDEDLWWSDIVDDLEDELDESTAVAPEEDTGYEGNTGIGNLLKQAADAASEEE